MDEDIVKAFSSEVASLVEMKPPVSKAKIVEVTRVAMRAVKFYKHVVAITEKFCSKCKPEYKIPGLYIIDSIVRQSQHQYASRDVFGPRFAKNMKATIQSLLSCSSSDKLKIVRVLNLWKSGKVFDDILVSDLLIFCSEHGIETDVQAVEIKVKGQKANMDIYSAPNSRKRRKEEDENESESPLPPTVPPVPELTVPSSIVPENGVSEQEFLDLIRSVNLDLGGVFSSNMKLLKSAHRLVNDKLVKQRELDTNSHGSIQKLLTREFDYSDEDSGDEGVHRPVVKEQPTQLTREEVVRIAGRILDQEEIKSEVKRMAERNIQEVNGQFIAPTQLPPAMPEQFSIPFPSGMAVPPPTVDIPPQAVIDSGYPAPVPPPAHTALPGSSAFSLPPPAFGLFGQNDRDDRRKRPRSRSPPHVSDISRSEVDREAELERRKLYLPPRTKPGHMLIGSRTIWLGKLPANTGENGIRAVLSEIGEPLRIDILPMRACAYVTMKDRKTAAKIVDKLKNSLQISKKYVKLDWAPGQMVKDRFKHHWDGDFGVTQIPYDEIPVDIESILDGVYVELDSLPEHLKGKFNENGEKRSGGGAVALPLPSLAQTMLVPQLPTVYPAPQFPFSLPPTPQGLQFLPPTFQLPPIVAVPEDMQNQAHAVVAATAAPMLPPAGPLPPSSGMHHSVLPGNGSFHPNAPFEPRDGRGMHSSRGGYRHQFFGNNHRGGRPFHNRPPPPHRFPPQQDFNRDRPAAYARSPPGEGRRAEGGERRRSRLFQSEQPRDVEYRSGTPPGHSSEHCWKYMLTFSHAAQVRSKIPQRIRASAERWYQASVAAKAATTSSTSTYRITYPVHFCL
ncbi:hypothetical protein QR680_009544 [Steinernema hermaphroditum]|uniref:CID domain-containing protein n=1 Tax=Steinernema hermaphroditum TaxID=289476 RepID=A0AA39MA37_9BILA|nr:hypothetical protein QR680_009544 [Steinernema hermaphroditum]